MNMKQKKLSSHLNPLKNKKETVSPILRSLGNVFHLAVVYRAFRQVSRFARRRHVVFYLALFFFPAAFLNSSTSTSFSVFMLYQKGFSKDSRNLWHTKFLSPFMTQLTCEEYHGSSRFVCDLREEVSHYFQHSIKVSRVPHTLTSTKENQNTHAWYLFYVSVFVSIYFLLWQPLCVMFYLSVLFVYATPLLGPLRTLFSIYFPCFLLILSESVSDRAFVEIHSLKAGEIFVSRASKETPEHCH